MRLSLLATCFLTFTAGVTGPPAFAKGKGGGQHHASKPHAAKPKRSHANAATAHSTQASNTNRSRSTKAAGGTTSGQTGLSGVNNSGSVASSMMPFLSYGALTPFGYHPALHLHGAYAAHRGYYGNRGYGSRRTRYASALMQRLSRLVRDLNTLTVGYVAPATDTTILRRDLTALTQGTLRPPSASVRQLTQDLIAQLPRRKTPLLNTERLALDLEKVMNGSRLNPAQVNSAINSARSILHSSGLAQPAVQTLTQDMKSVGQWGLAGNQAGLIR